MTEPITAGLGIKLATIVGGAIGSAIALANLPRMGTWQRIAAYSTGLGVALGVGPIISYGLALPEILNFPVGFVLGGCGMGLFGAAVRISSDPLGAWRQFKGTDQSGGQS